jgi:hypothetical protein
MTTAHLQRRAKEAKTFFEDGFGVWLHEVNDTNYPRASWPKVRCVHDDGASWRLRDSFIENCFGDCWVCNGFHMLECHHVVGGGMKCDSLTNLVFLCHACHEKHQSQRDDLKIVLAAKWKHDRLNLSWLRICYLLGRFLDFDSLEITAPGKP